MKLVLVIILVAILGAGGCRTTGSSDQSTAARPLCSGDTVNSTGTLDTEFQRDTRASGDLAPLETWISDRSTSDENPSEEPWITVDDTQPSNTQPTMTSPAVEMAQRVDEITASAEQYAQTSRTRGRAISTLRFRPTAGITSMIDHAQTACGPLARSEKVDPQFDQGSQCVQLTSNLEATEDETRARDCPSTDPPTASQPKASIEMKEKDKNPLRFIDKPIVEPAGRDGGAKGVSEPESDESQHFDESQRLSVEPSKRHEEEVKMGPTPAPAPFPRYSDTLSGTMAVVQDKSEDTDDDTPAQVINRLPAVTSHSSFSNYPHQRTSGGCGGCGRCGKRRKPGILGHIKPLWSGRECSLQQCDQCIGTGCRSCRCGSPTAGLKTGWLMHDSCFGLRAGGWLAQSFTANAHTPNQTRFNGPLTFVDRSDDYQLNQLYFYLKRDTDATSRTIDFGGRVDFLYGTDARFNLARGLDDNIVADSASRFYKLSIPQLYSEVRVNDFAVQFGRFYTIIGYETVTAPRNFFISHSYQMQYAEPFTHTGMLARYMACDEIIFMAGLTRGWDNWEDNNDDLDVIAGVNWTSWDAKSYISVAVTSGAQDNAGLNDRTVTSVVFQHEIFDNWNYVFHTDIGFENNGASANQDAEWYGLANYLTWDVNRCWSIGVRQEWFNDDDGVRVQGLGAPRGINLSPVPGKWQEVAAGVNLRPSENILVRSELRWDQFDELVVAPGGPFDDGNRRDQWVASFDLIIGF